MVQPAVEQDKIIGHYLRRIARLEHALRDIRATLTYNVTSVEHAFRAWDIASKALNQPAEEPVEEVVDG